MKVILSTPPGKTTEYWPPLGLLYIASSTLAKREDDIRIIDAFCENLTEDELVGRVVKEKPDVFGINCSTHTFLDAISTLERLHEKLPETKLVLGGFHATFAAEQILVGYPFLDYVVKGEAELSFPKLLDRIDRGEEPDDVEGVGFLRDGRMVINDPVLNSNLDLLPFPARYLAKEVEYGYYHKNIRLTFGKFTTVLSSRGCPYRCAYCSCAAFSQRRWRPRSPENVVDELERLYGEGYECLVFVDDNLTHSPARMGRICDLIKERRIRMSFYCEGRADNAPFDLLSKMKRAGFDVIYFGVESPQENVLEYYRKTVTAAHAEKAIANAKKAGMLVVTSYIVGAPVESIEDMNKTIEFISRVRPHAVQVNILDILIGTEIYERLKAQGVIRPDDWRTNHRIYEYALNGITKADLEGVVNRSYSAHIDAWKTREGIIELLKTLLANKTARSVVIGNLFNPSVRKRVSDPSRFDAAPGSTEPTRTF
jgi:anaerobic magnesium-protoporphyrin IX monomethyl ester cyclase